MGEGERWIKRNNETKVVCKLPSPSDRRSCLVRIKLDWSVFQRSTIQISTNREYFRT